MKVRFIAPNPREKARFRLDDVLRHGRDQLAIACAFLTRGGAEVLKKHVARLNLPNSFIVVAWETPTDLDALNELHNLIPRNLYIHLGAQTPVEKGVGRGLMHSKVFYARSGNQCQLWTGSHNLTASAVLGVNCEAAIVLEGTADEQPFQDALSHLIRCKDEAILFDPSNPPRQPVAQTTLIIHAECDVALKNCPWFVHFRAATVDYDQVLRPPGAVWLYLYAPGTLQRGQHRPKAWAAFSGRITALNFTENHPSDVGIPADWRDANFIIEEDRQTGVFHLIEPTPHTKTPTQGVFRMETQDDPRTVWLSDNPTPKLERVVGTTNVSEIDPEFRRFFTKQSLNADGLVHQEYRSLQMRLRLPRKEVGEYDNIDLQDRFDLPQRAEVLIDETMMQGDRFEFIYRAKYRK